MHIRMLKTENGSVDGIRVASYEGGADYVLGATDGERSLAAAFVGAGCAVELNGAQHGHDGDGDGDAAPSGGPEPGNPGTPIDEPEPAAPAAKQGRGKKQ